MKKLKKEKQLKSNKGITLIALVITIIVLLILAGVSIAMLTGQNGILTQAQNAKNRTEEAQAEEENRLNEYNNIINNYVNGGTTTGGDEEESGEQAVVGEKVTGGNKPYTNNGTAIIPEGFAIVPGLNDVSQGLVISDVANDTENTGNQFVWVPVENFSEFKRYDFQNNKEFSTNEESGDGTSTGTEAQDMYKSVNDNKGFYIGRYEAGNDGSNNAISKKGVSVYNNIKWGNSMIDEKGGAVEKARNFGTQSGHTNVTSTLVYGVQWDAVMRWISKDDSLKGYLTDSSDIGNYPDNDNTNNPAKTGSNDNYQMKHIYDLAGNVYEWTMEARSTFNRVTRGRLLPRRWL